MATDRKFCLVLSCGEREKCFFPGTSQNLLTLREPEVEGVWGEDVWVGDRGALGQYRTK